MLRKTPSPEQVREASRVLVLLLSKHLLFLLLAAVVYLLLGGTLPWLKNQQAKQPDIKVEGEAVQAVPGWQLALFMSDQKNSELRRERVLQVSKDPDGRFFLTPQGRVNLFGDEQVKVGQDVCVRSFPRLKANGQQVFEAARSLEGLRSCR